MPLYLFSYYKPNTSTIFLFLFTFFLLILYNERQAAYLRNALFDQGYLDEQFLQLEDLQDETNPHFVEEVVKLFYTDSKKHPRDFEKLDKIMHQFKGSSTSIGAKKVKKECTQFQEYCNVGNVEGCIREFQEVKQEHAASRGSLSIIFRSFTLCILQEKLVKSLT
ncbi:hypothetical protein SASPL_150878 [Salvia splendens]|uniref:Histidine-containing phosphotransfer protein n=1 Tax=Salvia splendens TaxID=180675 RepID=A0A8X8W7B5_SALSN|nr:hypothetical protein SASPL_150878 [Salvia splendens]